MVWLFFFLCFPGCNFLLIIILRSLLLRINLPHATGIPDKMKTTTASTDRPRTGSMRGGTGPLQIVHSSVDYSVHGRCSFPLLSVLFF